MASRATLKAADADRDEVAERLRRASAEGRLLTEELEQRLELALRARTYGELDALIADLPGRRMPVPAQPRQLRLAGPAMGLAIAVPLALIAIAVALLVITGVLAGWCLWLAFAWWFWGPRRRRQRYRARYRGCGALHATRRHAHYSRTV